MYSGSKAFVEKFSASLAAEAAGTTGGGVVVQDHIPFFVGEKEWTPVPRTSLPPGGIRERAEKTPM